MNLPNMQDKQTKPRESQEKLHKRTPSELRANKENLCQMVEVFLF